MHRNMVKSGLILLTIQISFLAFVDAQKPIDIGLKSINSDDLIQTIGYLSSSRFKGRMQGTAEYDQAARYVATRLKSAGLSPIGQPSMLQYFNDEINIINKAEFYLLNKNGKAEVPCQLGEDFMCRGFTGSGKISAEVVFAGFGVKTDEYNDYRNIDVKGKIVMVYKSVPPWKSKSGNWGDTSPRGKARIAKENGAIGIILIADPKIFPSTMIYGSIACGDGPHLSDFPMIQISKPVTDSIFSHLPYNSEQAYNQIVNDKAPHSVETERSVLIDIEASYREQQPTANVVGIIEGTDPKLKNEYVIIGAHLDHVGYQTDKIFFPGANDNASGVASLIAIAEAIKKSNVKLKRSVVFVIFSSEESGLHGSKYFVEHSPIDLTKAVAMMNFDCVGQGDSIAIGGKLSFPKLWKKAKRIDKKQIKLLSSNSFGGGGADADAFYKVGISTLYFNTTGGYKYLHQTTDKTETINTVLVEKITKLGYLIVVRLANGKYRGEKDKLRKK